MSTSTAADVVTGFEAKLTEAPDLGYNLSFLLAGPDADPSQRAASAVQVQREISRNLNQTRNQDTSRVEDLVIVRLSQRISPKAQKTSRNTAYAAEQSIVHRLTDLDWERRWNVTHLDTREILKPEWLVLLIRFSVKRYQPVGSG